MQIRNELLERPGCVVKLEMEKFLYNFVLGNN